jgi:hypothetical protein
MAHTELVACAATGIITAPFECFPPPRPSVIRAARIGGWDELMHGQPRTTRSMSSVDLGLHAKRQAKNLCLLRNGVTVAKAAQC